MAASSLSPPALVVRALTKSFGARRVVNLDLQVPSGVLYALLGPNGAGKTTTLRMVAGLLSSDGGAVHIFGIDTAREPAAAKRIVAWLPDDPLLYDKLTPLEYLEFVAGLWSVEPGLAETRAHELLQTLNLWAHRHDRCEGFSRGMKQKTALAGALIHDPKLLILDEPLTGLDAAAARQVKELLAARVAAGGTVILTTHILEVAERLATRIGVIRDGRLLAEGTAAEIADRAGRHGATLEEAFLALVGSPVPAELGIAA